MVGVLAFIEGLFARMELALGVCPGASTTINEIGGGICNLASNPVLL
jgi:hypothetical protein